MADIMSCTKVIHVLLFSLMILLEAANCLKCKSCGSVEYDSGCRTGMDEKAETCNSNEGDDACYAEYLLGRRETDVPLYRRGCAPINWCETQKRNHGTALKDCMTCRGDECNNKPLGALNLDYYSQFMCRKCSSKEGDSPCVHGTDLKKVACGPDDICMSYSLFFPYKGFIAKRGCGKLGFCTELGKKFIEVEHCTECEEEFCNNVSMLG